MNKNVLISISDIHFGHNKVPTEYIYNRLFKFFIPTIEQYKDYNTIFITINGDIFDKNLSLTSLDTRLIIEFFIKFYDLLENINDNNHSVYLRIIRGTYAHDRDQIKVLEKLYYTKDYHFNFKYIDKIQIESINNLYIHKKLLHILYLPDDLPFNSSYDIISHIKSLMSKLNIQKLDYVFGHGNFQHVFPPNLRVYPKITYKIEQFKSIVRKLIIFGHIHNTSQKSLDYIKVIYTGSFDRLRHNETLKKGFLVIEDFLNPKYKIKFIINKKATPFIDLYYDKSLTDLNLMINHITSILESYNQHPLIYMRLIDVPTEYKHTIRQFINQYNQSNRNTTKISFYTSKYLSSNTQSDNNISKSLLFNEFTSLDKNNFSLENLTIYIKKQLSEQYNISIDIDKLKSYLE